MATGSRASSLTIAASGRVAARALTEASVRALRVGQSRSDGALPVGNGRLVIVCASVRGRTRRTCFLRRSCCRTVAVSCPPVFGRGTTLPFGHDRLSALVRDALVAKRY